MSEPAKITLSPDELLLACDGTFILTKRAVIAKTAMLFNSLVPAITACFSNEVPGMPLHSQPKISKGENYSGYPYVILDYPAVFAKENSFALRTMFWWGQFFSVTLHLSGSYKKLFEDRILSGPYDPALFVATGADEWAHHFEKGNFQPLFECSTQEKASLREKSFLKVAVKYDVSEFNEMPVILPAVYRKIRLLLDYR